MNRYSTFRSSASFRVRLPLALKGLPYGYVSVHLARGKHPGNGYGDIAADRLVPLVQFDGGMRLSQSLAIIEYLDETHPEPPLLPGDAPPRAWNPSSANLPSSRRRPSATHHGGIRSLLGSAILHEGAAIDRAGKNDPQGLKTQ